MAECMYGCLDARPYPAGDLCDQHAVARPRSHWVAYAEQGLRVWRDRVLERIAAADGELELRRIWHEVGDRWTADMTAAAAARKGQLLATAGSGHGGEVAA